jgi:hypothetical protein
VARAAGANVADSAVGARVAIGPNATRGNVEVTLTVTDEDD